MSLLEIRTWLVNESGRFDLVVDTTGYADAGADKFIKAGQMMLDDMQETTHGSATNIQSLVAGEDIVQLGLCRYITEVYCMNSTDSSRWKLHKGIKEYHSSPTNALTFPPTETGPPRHYEELNFRFSPEAPPADVPANYLRYMVASPHLITGIRLDHIADVDYLIETKGSFYTPFLVEDTDDNYWSYMYPHLLVMAAQCIMEMFHRNSEGVNDWMKAIQLGLMNIDHNLVARDIVGISRMEG